MDAMIEKTFNYLAETAGIPTEELISRMTKLIHKITIEEHSYLHQFQLRYYGTVEPSPEEWIQGLISIMISDQYSISDHAYAGTAFYMAGDPYVMMGLG